VEILGQPLTGNRILEADFCNTLNVTIICGIISSLLPTLGGKIPMIIQESNPLYPVNLMTGRRHGNHSTQPQSQPQLLRFPNNMARELVDLEEDDAKYDLNILTKIKDDT